MSWLVVIMIWFGILAIGAVISDYIIPLIKPLDRLISRWSYEEEPITSRKEHRYFEQTDGEAVLSGSSQSPEKA